MGNVMGTVLSGFGEILGKLLGHPLDFLAGKACSSVCAPTWDFLCYIENFCISQLLKSTMVSILLYFVVLFLYLLYKLGICQCICHILCRCTWACFSTCFSVLDCCCTFLCFKFQQLLLTPRRRQKSDIEGEGSFSCRKIDGRRRRRRRSIREHRKEHMRKSLRPIKSHRMQVEIVNDSIHPKKKLKIGNSNEFRPADHIRVSRRPNFARKGTYKGSSHHP
ncbi:PREDICTED: uncharacterized protein LOC109214163 [Nicotiana attenuata]|uniref:Uncharacterized protein n=1 Tax=Nicotiana attenuata TaxID=49451 RepID=A0A1J6KB25_NICAT|nr:PREDICTED: uncharacterized protein LOC109214163 [Nicotiana attenuata]OIT27274.1 hypothetical protein A4A49_36087 [Nicotiana attenuata]